MFSFSALVLWPLEPLWGLGMENGRAVAFHRQTDSLSLGFHCCSEAPGPKSNLGRQGFILAHNIQVTHYIAEGGQARNRSETMDECWLLVCFSLFAQPAFLSNPGPPIESWDLPHQSKKMPYRIVYRSPYGGIFPVESPL